MHIVQRAASRRRVASKFDDKQKPPITHVITGYTPDLFMPVLRGTRRGEGRGGGRGPGYRLISCRPNSERVSRLPTGFNNRCREYSVQIYKSGRTIAADYPFYTYVLMKYFCRQLSVTAPQLRAERQLLLDVKGRCISEVNPGVRYLPATFLTRKGSDILLVPPSKISPSLGPRPLARLSRGSRGVGQPPIPSGVR